MEDSALEWHKKERVSGVVGAELGGALKNVLAQAAEMGFGMNLGIEAELPHEKKSRHRAYQELYTPETAELVRQHWREDVETFGYEH